MKVLHAYCGRQHWSAINPVCEELKKRGHEIAEVSVIHDDIRKRKPGFEDVDMTNGDIFLCAYPRIMLYNHPEDGKISFDHGCKKTVCIEHGVNPIASAFPLDRHNLFDKVFTAGRWQMDAIRRSPFAFELLPKCVMTGWAKADFLVGKGTQEYKQEYRKKLEEMMPGKFKPDQPFVTWTPTHNCAWDRTDEIVEAIGDTTNLIIAPHEGSYAAFRDGRLKMNYEKDYPYYIKTEHIYDVLLAADIEMTDYSSAGIEATVLDMPVIQILKDVELHARPGMNPMKVGFYLPSQGDTRPMKLGGNIRDVKASLAGEIETAMEQGSDYYAKERRFWRDEIFYNLGGAAKKCADLIEQMYETM